MNDWDRLTMVQEHCDDMLRYALTEQMVRQAFRQENGHRGFRCRALCGLGRRLAAVRAELDTIQATFPTVQILDQTEFKETISGQINQLLSLVYALLGLSVIIAIFGVINTLALSIIERTREIGMLRAVGMLRTQVRSMIRWESIVISFFGAFTGVALGLLLGVALQRLLVNDGITELAIPWTLIVVVLVATAVVGILAAVWPARRAANLDVLMAIRTE